MGDNIVYIDGYWLNPNGSKADKFEGYKCQLTEWDGEEDEIDESIFYYFNGGIEELKQHMNPENTSSEFIITDFYYTEPGTCKLCGANSGGHCRCA